MSDSERWDGPIARALRALGPVAGGVLLDLVDLASFGPVGVVPGLAIGGGLGWVLSGVYGYSSSLRPIIAIAAAVYCATPLTEPLPLATIASLVARLAPSNRPAPGSRRSRDDGDR